jgi:carbon storage regulator
MLVLSRKKNERVVFGEGEIVVTVVEIRGDKVRLGIEAPKDLPVHREEVFQAIAAEREHNSLDDGEPEA